MSYNVNREYEINNTFNRITAAQELLDRLLDDSRRLRAEYDDIRMRDRYIERCIDNLAVVREDFEKNVLKIKPTAALDRAYEKDLS